MEVWPLRRPQLRCLFRIRGSEDPRMRLLSDLPAVCVQASPLCANLALKHYLLKPVQRIPQYQLLLTGTTTERGTKRLTSCPV